MDDRRWETLARMMGMQVDRVNAAYTVIYYKRSNEYLKLKNDGGIECSFNLGPDLLHKMVLELAKTVKNTKN